MKNTVSNVKHIRIEVRTLYSSMPSLLRGNYPRREDKNAKLEKELN